MAESATSQAGPLVMRDIVNFPDRLRLASCLLLGDNKEQDAVHFRVQNPDNQSHEWDEHIKLNSIEREDGSGNNFNLTGYNIANSCLVQIYINLQTRRGKMTFMKKT